jgi:PAS domain S-box-containing protein
MSQVKLLLIEDDGYSSLSNVHQLPITIIKVDRSFVDRIDERKGRSMLETIATMARSLEVTAIAEGIERVDQRNSLEALGYEVGQGTYSIGRVDLPRLKPGFWPTGPFNGWKMTEHTSVQALFDSWVESNEPASMDTSFLYHHWMEQMDVQVIAHRPDGTIVYANQAVADLLGRRRSEVHGRPIEELFGAQWSTAHMEHVAAATTSTGAVLSELRFDLDGGRHFEITTTVIFTSEGNPGLVGLVMKDITGLVDARNERHELNQRLRGSNRDLEDFAYVASHDLQEPLRKISAFGERLRVRLGDDVDAQVPCRWAAARDLGRGCHDRRTLVAVGSRQRDRLRSGICRKDLHCLPTSAWQIGVRRNRSWSCDLSQDR